MSLTAIYKSPFCNSIALSSQVFGSDNPEVKRYWCFSLLLFSVFPRSKSSVTFYMYKTTSQGKKETVVVVVLKS